MKFHFIPIITLLAIQAPSAAASSFYFEFAGGIAQYRQSEGIGGSQVDSTSNIGAAVNSTLLFSFDIEKSAVQFQIGVQDRFSLVSSRNMNLGLHVPYAVLRLQITKIFVGVGYAPMVWKRVSDTTGIDNFNRLTDGKSIMGEAGLLWSVTPKFSLGAAAGMQMVSASGVNGPRPAFDLTALMRFYFGFMGDGKSSRGSNEFMGWRYPFGQEMR